MDGKTRQEVGGEIRIDEDKVRGITSMSVKLE